MKWIKAVEQLPKEGIQVCAKWKGSYYKIYAKSGKIYFGNTQIEWETDKENIEWLDESSSGSASAGEGIDKDIFYKNKMVWFIDWLRQQPADKFFNSDTNELLNEYLSLPNEEK